MMRGAEASQVYLTLPAVAGEPSKRLVGLRRSISGQARAGWSPSSSTRPPPTTPLLFPARRERDVGRRRLAHTGRYTVHVGTSSADTPLEATVVLSSRRDRTPVDVDAPTPRPREGGGDDAAFRVDPRRE